MADRVRRSILMQSFLRRPRDLVRQAQKAIPEAPDGQPNNPFDELHLLREHSDIVRHMLLIEGNRIASSSDDHTVIVWDLAEYRRMQVLRGHSLPVTCMLWATQSGSGRLLTGSADKCIIVWNIDTGEPSARWSKHKGSVKTLVYLKNGVCCSGGKDLCLWHIDSNELISQYKRDYEDSDVQRIVLLDRNRLLVASEEKDLVIFQIQNLGTSDQIRIVQQMRLEQHREAIRDAIYVSPNKCVTGSLDGVIKVWDSRTIEELHEFNFHETYKNEESHEYEYSVQHMSIIQDDLIAVAIGHGFGIYDTERGKRRAQQWHAHQGRVTRIQAFEDVMCLVTASVDATIRIWDLQKLALSPTIQKAQPTLIGELVAHTNCVNDILMIRAGIVSCGSDGMVIVWKNGVVEERRRNKIARHMLQVAEENQKRSNSNSNRI